MAASLLLVASTAHAQIIARYDANAGEDLPADAAALDGTFSHDNGSDAWDGSGFGDGKAGGAQVIDGSYLRLQDPGDPRDHGQGPDPSNRKLYFTKDLGARAALLDTGVTLNFRARTSPDGDDIHPDGGGPIESYPEDGDGYVLHNGGKGSIGIRQASGGLISFSFTDDGSGLAMNPLNGNVITGDANTGDGTANIVGGINNTEWHDFHVTIEAGGEGTHVVNVWVDGADSPLTYDVTAGNGSDAGGSYLALGVGATPESGAIDIDFVCVREGLIDPIPRSRVPTSTNTGILFAALALAGAGFLVLRRRRKLAAS